MSSQVVHHAKVVAGRIKGLEQVRDDYAAVAGLLPYCRTGLIACSLP